VSDDTRDTTANGTAEPEKKRNPFVNFLARLFKEKPLGAAGFIIVLIMLLTGIFADLLAPFGYNEIHLRDTMQGPSARYWLGTDQVGRDLLSRVIYGARISMIVGVCTVLLQAVIGAAIGWTSGYIGGKFDLIVQRFVDAWMSLPMLVLLIIVMSLIGPGMLQIILVLSVWNGIAFSRGSRGLVISIKQAMYFDAARSIGATTPRILFRHLFPNIFPFTIVGISMAIAGIILTEASLSFLGYGIPAPFPSWGQMLSVGRSFMIDAPWMAIWPGLALTLVVYGMNMFGDAVRDLVDPRLRGGLGRYGGAEKEIKKELKARSKKQGAEGIDKY